MVPCSLVLCKYCLIMVTFIIIILFNNKGYICDNIDDQKFRDIKETISSKNEFLKPPYISDTEMVTVISWVG